MNIVVFFIILVVNFFIYKNFIKSRFTKSKLKQRIIINVGLKMFNISFFITQSVLFVEKMITGF